MDPHAALARGVSGGGYRCRPRDCRRAERGRAARRTSRAEANRVGAKPGSRARARRDHLLHRAGMVPLLRPGTVYSGFIIGGEPATTEATEERRFFSVAPCPPRWRAAGLQPFPLPTIRNG